MRDYLLRRLVLFVPTIIGASLVVFFLVRVAPGDPALAILQGSLGQNPFSQKDYEKLRKFMGLDEPMPVQYAKWFGSIIRGDLGESSIYRIPVSDILRRRFPVTLELTVLALAFTWTVAIPVGILSALKQDTWIDYILRVFSIVGVSMPLFWTGILILFALVVFFDWFPPVPFRSFQDDPWNNLQTMIWPAVALGYFAVAVLSRMVRSTMLEVLREDYIRTARSKGLVERVVVLRHAFKNSMLPVITLMGLQLAAIISGTVVLERIFSIPGMGNLILRAVTENDYYALQATVLAYAFVFLVLNLIVDLSYGWLDPRVRYG